MEDMDWRLRAACRDEDPELFFPVGTSGPAIEQTAEAKAVCRRCEVTSDCLSFAITEGLPEGIFGGRTPAERPKPKRRKPGPKPDVDEVVVARAIAGKRVGRRLTPRERVQVAEQLMAAGGTFSAAAEASGCSWSTLRGLVAS